MKTMHPWPPQFLDPSHNRIIAFSNHRDRVKEFFSSRRPSKNMSEFVRINGSVTRQRLHQIESHAAAVTQRTALQYAQIYNDDPLRLQLRTGECPNELAYLLGWELWDQFEQFLTHNLKKD